MGTTARLLLVSTSYSLLGALSGVVLGVALGTVFGLIFGRLLEAISEAVLYCVVLHSLLLAVAAVLCDEGDSLDVFCLLRRKNMRRPAVLLLCTNNAARSQMAEALLKTKAPDYFEAYSAGTEPKSAIDPLTVRVMHEVGIDLAGQRPKGLFEYLGRLPVRVAISVCPRDEDKCPTTWPGALARLEWPFEDPAACQGNEEERLEKFRVVRDQIDQKITNWLTELTAGK